MFQSLRLGVWGQWLLKSRHSQESLANKIFLSTNFVCHISLLPFPCFRCPAEQISSRNWRLTLKTSEINLGFFFVEEQRWFLRHCWPHDIKLVESNRLKAYPRSCLLSHCLNCEERDDVESKLSLVAETDGVWINNNKSMVFHRAICNQRTLSVLMETLG